MLVPAPHTTRRADLAPGGSQGCEPPSVVHQRDEPRFADARVRDAGVHRSVPRSLPRAPDMGSPDRVKPRHAAPEQMATTVARGLPTHPKPLPKTATDPAVQVLQLRLATLEAGEVTRPTPQVAPQLPEQNSARHRKNPRRQSPDPGFEGLKRLPRDPDPDLPFLLPDRETQETAAPTKEPPRFWRG